MSAPGAYIFGCEGPRLSATEKAFFAESDPLGFILFARNVDSPGQLRSLTSELRDCVGRDAMILIDQEGGRVERLTAPHWREWIPPLSQVEGAAEAAAEIMKLRYRVIAAELRAVGVDVNCAPCADIARPDTHPVLYNRCYGMNPVQVAKIGRAVADGLLAGGVLPVLKHIPGHGAATADSHLELPRVDLPAQTLFDDDFNAFKALSDLPLGMTAHVVFEALDSVHCATNSSIVHQIMRKDIGFDGLLMSDDISMHALSGDMQNRCEIALGAGCDIILHCNGKMPEMIEIAKACGALNTAALTRADAALALRGAPEDPVDLIAQWDARMAVTHV